MIKPPPNLRKRLWLAGSGIALFLLTLVVAGALLDPAARDGRLWLGHDFLPAYVAGGFVRTGEPAKMYDRSAFLAAQDRVVRDADLEMTGRYAAALNPPHFALLFAPLSALPYRTAAAVWLTINVALLAASVALLVGLLPPDARLDWKTWGLVPLLVTTSMPFLQAAGHQQNTFLSLLILTATVALWRQRRAFAAGAVLGLLFYKPQLALVIALVLVVDLGRRAVLGLGITGTALLLLTVLLAPGALGAYFHNLASNLAWIQAQPTYNWGRQVTLLGFARFLGAPAPVARALWITTCAFGLVALAARTRPPRATRVRLFPSPGTPGEGEGGGSSHWCRGEAPPPQPSPGVPGEGAIALGRSRAIALTLTATPLLIPYCLDYDLLLLAVPAILFAGDWMTSARPTHRVDRVALWAWLALYAWLFANPGLAGVVRVSLTVPLLATLATAMILRDRASREAVEQRPQPAPPPREADRPEALAA
jgi:hypothetical protein